jgi:hypothetical protein
MVRQLLQLARLRPASGSDGQIDYRGGPFPERWVVEFEPAAER